MASFNNDTSGPPSSSSDAPQLLRIPTWIDVSIHGVPAIVLVIGKSYYIHYIKVLRPLTLPAFSKHESADFFFREKKYRAPVSTWGAIILSAIAGLAYSIWVEHCAAYNDRCKSLDPNDCPRMHCHSVTLHHRSPVPVPPGRLFPRKDRHLRRRHLLCLRSVQSHQRSARINVSAMTYIL
jgi:hypothetical protein